MKNLIQQILEISSDFYVQLLFLFIGIFLTSLYLIPKIRILALGGKSQEQPNSRSSHSGLVPTFGGVAFYISYIITLFIIQFYDIISTYYPTTS